VFQNVLPLPDCVWHGPKWQYIGHKNNGSRNSEIAAGSVFCTKACRKIIRNASAVYQNVFPLPDCVWHGPKWQYIGHKNNGSRNSEIAARSVFCNNACRKLIQNASAVFQNVFPPPHCVRHGPKWQYIGHKNNGSRNSEIAAGSVSCTNACRKLIQNASAVYQNIFSLPDCVRHGPKWQYIGHKNNGSRNSEIAAGSVSCTNACRKLIQNASAVYQNVFSVPDCVRHSPKWQYIGHKNNGSRNSEIAAGSVFCNNACRKIIQNASAVFQNVFPPPDCIRHSPKWQYIGHKNNGSRNHAGSVFNACRNIIQYLSAVFQNVFPHSDCLWHCPKCREIGTKSGKEFIPDVV